MKYVCNFCGKEFSSKRELAELLRVCPNCREIHSKEIDNLRKESNKLKREEKKHYWAEHPLEYQEFLRIRKEKTEKSKIEKYGSLEKAEEIRRAKQLETLKKKYPDEDWDNITNPSQLTSSKALISERLSSKTSEDWKERQEKSIATKIEKYGSLENYYSQTQEKIRKTSIEKYGVDHPQKVESIIARRTETFNRHAKEEGFLEKRDEKAKQTRILNSGSLKESYRTSVEKAKETCIERYGVSNPNKNKSIKEKASITRDKKLNENPNFYREIAEKSKATKIKKYGSLENASITAKEKRAETCIKKYGVNSPLESKEVQSKILYTLDTKYGVSNPSQIEGVQDKVKNTILSRYGSYSNMRTTEQRRALKEKIHNENMDKYRNIDFSKLGFRYFEKDNLPWVKCLKCGKEFQVLLPPSHIKSLHCMECDPILMSSSIERDLVAEIKSWGITNIITNDRKILNGKELDIYLPDFNLAIEYDGCYWHNSEKKDKKYHLEKTLACKEKGIHLVHIFDEELFNKRELTLDILKKMMNISNKIGARKCKVVELSDKEYKEFVEDNHLQGYTPVKVRLGLVYNNSLVAVMSFSKPRFAKDVEWELNRYCEIMGSVIIGGKEKLLDYFEKNYHPKSLISYCDLRWFKGTSYTKMGFDLVKISEPNYKYFKSGYYDFHSRLEFQKHKMKDIKGFLFDENLSEYENMRNNGYLRIFDCGNEVFLKRY